MVHGDSTVTQVSATISGDDRNPAAASGTVPLRSSSSARPPSSQLFTMSRGNQRDTDRARAQARVTKGKKNEDGLTPAQRQERCAFYTLCDRWQLWRASVLSNDLAVIHHVVSGPEAGPVHRHLPARASLPPGSHVRGRLWLVTNCMTIHAHQVLLNPSMPAFAACAHKAESMRACAPGSRFYLLPRYLSDR